MAAGKVVIGFSKPYVALYGNTGTTLRYTNGQVLARGVSVQLAPESSDDNIFYADNETAETDAGMFTGGQVILGVDGLLIAAERMIMGLPAEVGTGDDKWTEYDDDQQIPFCGLGYIVKYMSGGVITYVPTVLYKVVFSQIEQNATTQGETVDWQTQSLTAQIYRSDNAKHAWKSIGSDFSTEAAAEAALKKKLGITVS